MKVKVALIFISVVWPVLAWGGWVSETVAAEGSVGSGCSLAVDQWGRPHITYKDATNAKIMYAFYDGSSWTFQTVYEDAANVGDTALALDALGKPHVAFGDDQIGELVYGYTSGGSWKTETVEAATGSTSLGNSVSVTAWPSGPKVAYNRMSGGSVSIKYAYKEGTEWQTEYVVQNIGASSISIFVDNDAKPNVVFYSGKTESVKHGVRGTEEWTVDDLAEGIDCNGVLGPQGKTHVSFAKPDNAGILYAVSTGGSWKFENVGAVVGDPGFTRICVNGDGGVFISYFNWAKTNLHVMTKSGGTWTHELVAKGSLVGLPHSIALGSDGYPLIAYYDGDNNDLKLARYDSYSDIEVRSFAADRVQDGVRLEWSVGGLSEIAGFNLYRASAGSDADSSRAKLNGPLIIGRSPFGYLDEVPAGRSYNYWLEVVPVTGAPKEYGPATAGGSSRVKSFALAQSYPNPARDATTFTFELAEAGDVRLDVYDLSGRLVATPAAASYGDGVHDVGWNLDVDGRRVPPGVYLYTLRAGSYMATKKLVVAR
jgi:hypothetical protein